MTGKLNVLDSSYNEITAGFARTHGIPDPIWWAKACRQIGIKCGISQYTKENGQPDVKVQLPPLPDHVMENIKKRAELLAERDKQGLPTEEKPSGGFPDSEDEIADPIALKVGVDEEKKVVIDFGRAVRAVSIHPAAASYLSTLLTQAAIDAGLDTSEGMENMKVRVGKVKCTDGKLREALVKMPSPFGTEGDDDEC